MRFSLLALGCSFVLATCVTALAAAADKKPAGDEARAAAAKWLDGLDQQGLVLSEKVTEGGFAVTHGPSAVGRVTKFTYQKSGWQVSFAFRGELNAATPLETLNKEFWYVALDRLPTPGLDLPGWDVWPQTPTSTLRQGVEVLAYGDGKIKLRVRAKFFALYGRDPSVVVPADAAAPAGSYFQIRKAFPLDLTLEAPFALKGTKSVGPETRRRGQR